MSDKKVCELTIMDITERMLGFTTRDETAEASGYSDYNTGTRDALTEMREDMQKLINVNAGMERRFKFRIPFDDYSNEELTLMYKNNVARKKLKLAEGCDNKILAWFKSQPRGKNFAVNVREISVSGTSNRAYGIFLFIILGLMIVAIGRSHPVKEYDEKK